MSRIVSLNLRPRYAETDQMGIVYYANYLVWFECGRSEYMRAVGMPYTELESRGYYFPVTEFQCRLTASARYDEEITVQTRVQELKSRQLCYAYDVTRDEQLLASGTTTHMCVNDQQRPVRFPKWLLDGLSA